MVLSCIPDSGKLLIGDEDGEGTPDPRQIGDGDGDADRGFRALPVH
jgi:hypothetical protein